MLTLLIFAMCGHNLVNIPEIFLVFMVCHSVIVC